MSLLKDVIGYGTHADRPAAGSAGRLYYETDTSTLVRDSGTVWVALSLGSGTPSVVTLDDVYLASTSASTFHFTAIDQSYNALRLILRATSTYATDALNKLRIFFNGDTTSSNYGSSAVQTYGSTGVVGAGTWSDTGAYVAAIAGTVTIQPLLQDMLVLDIPGYADTHIEKAGLFASSYHITGDHGINHGKIHWLDTSAINEILLRLDQADFAQYSRATLYGIV